MVARSDILVFRKMNKMLKSHLNLLYIYSKKCKYRRRKGMAKIIRDGRSFCDLECRYLRVRGTKYVCILEEEEENETRQSM